MNKKDEELMAQYADSIENKQSETPDSISIPTENTGGIGMPDKVAKLRAQQMEHEEEYNRYTMDELHEQKKQQIQEDAINRGTTLAPIRMEDLPSKGLFYPKGTEIWIQPVRLKDIKRWTSMDETDPQDVNLKMQNILESCCKVSYGANSMVSGNWKDLIDIDRLYLIVAIHDYSFQQGKNDIMVKIDEKNDVAIRKENINYIKFSDKLMKFYDDQKRCFRFPVRNKEAFSETGGMMEIYMPKIGVANWLVDYMTTNEQRKDNYDRDMVVYANMLIKDWRGLNIDKYYKLIEKTDAWGSYEWTLISKIRDIIQDAVMTPTVTYKDNGGVEREARLSFRNGFKGIFQQSLDIDL